MRNPRDDWSTRLSHMVRKRRWRVLLGAGVLSVGAVCALRWGNACGQWEERPPVVLEQARAQGPLRAGAARVELALPYPVVVAGYAPPRPETSQAVVPVYARAVVLEAQGVRVGLLSLELLLASERLVATVRERAAGLGLQGLVVAATHTHSSVGGYDARWMAQLAGTGRYQEEAEEALVAGALQALRQAAARLEEATWEVGEAREPQWVYSRSEGEEPTGALERGVLRAQGRVVAELLVFAGHPTLVPRREPQVDPDWPGRLSLLREAQGGVALVLQGASGNVAVGYEHGAEGRARADAFARALHGLAERVELKQVESPGLGWARAEVALPRPDGSRLVPEWVRGAGETFLCYSSPRLTEVGALRLGPWELLAVPGEPTVGAGQALAGRSGASGVLGLASGYVGYVELPERVERNTGEAHRQYFGASLLERLGAGAEVAGRAAGFER